MKFCQSIPQSRWRGRTLMLLALLLCIALPKTSSAQRVSVVLENVSLAEALKKVSAASGYEFFYNSNVVLKSDKRITASFDGTELKTVLDHVFSGTEFSYRIKDRTIVVVPRPAQPAPEEPAFVEIAGRITDGSNKAPMAGVTVVVEGSTIGTSSDADGRYVLKIPAGIYNIMFSFIGYEIHVKRYNGQNLADFRKISLTPTSVEVADVVVTGVYQRKKESFTGSATTFKSKELKAVGTQSVLQSLRTLDPSFKISESVQFGSDPNRMPDFEIRGKSSVIGLKEEYGTDPNQPLFILDGFETTLETVMNLNMNRVASVTLLKDAASTAIYGSKASNGVVVIETKAPEQGRLQLSYKGDFSVTMADLTDYNLMNSSEKLQFETLAGVYQDTNQSMANQLRLDDLRNERLKGIARGIDTYWLNEPLRTGFTHRHNIYAEGGEEKIRYGIGLSYGEVQGVMKGSDRQTIGGNIDLIYRTGKFQFSNKLTLDYQKTNDPAVPFSEYAQANPYFKKYNDEGRIDRYLYYYQDPELLETEAISNPLWNAHLNNYDKGDQFGFTNNFIIEWFVAKDLRNHARHGNDRHAPVAPAYGFRRSGGDRKGPLHPLDDQAHQLRGRPYGDLRPRAGREAHAQRRGGIQLQRHEKDGQRIQGQRLHRRPVRRSVVRERLSRGRQVDLLRESDACRELLPERWLLLRQPLPAGLQLPQRRRVDVRHEQPFPQHVVGGRGLEHSERAVPSRQQVFPAAQAARLGG